MATSESIDPETAFAQLARIKLSETDLRGVLGTIAGLTRRTVPGADEVSVTLVRHQKAQTAVSTGDLALRLDEAQYALGVGPCLDASGTAAAMVLPRIATETRWPEWTRLALELGAGSSLSVRAGLSQDTNRKLRDVAATLVAQAPRRS